MIKKVSENRIFRFGIYCVFCIMIVLLQSIPSIKTKETEELFSSVEVLATISNNDSLYSQNAIITERNSGSVLFELNSNEKVKTASLTKIMTACVALEEIDFGATFTFDYEIIEKLKNENVIRAGFEATETVCCKDLLYATLLESSADGAVGLASIIGDDDFIELMNLRAQKLGMNNTHFSNPVGIDEEENYSTAYDLSLLVKYALTNGDFVQIISSGEYRTRKTEAHPCGILLENQVLQNAKKYSLNIVGGKSGYTEEAGLCLASFNEKYIVITLNAGKSKSPLYNFADALTLYSLNF